jgi:predicted type IV restriction endonuclease
MEFAIRLNELAARISRQKSFVTTEEAAKTAFVLPFLQALGYDVFNPMKVTPEFTAYHGTKKGEKIDYAISINNEIRILIERKPVGSPLETKHASQLYRYFLGGFSLSFRRS